MFYACAVKGYMHNVQVCIFIIQGVLKKAENGNNMPFVPIIIGIPYTVPCACASRETVCTGRQDPGARSAERAEQSRKAAQWSKGPGVQKRGVGGAATAAESASAMPSERSE